MSSSHSKELRAEVRSLIATAKLAKVFFVDISMAREEGETPAPEVQFPVNLTMGAQATDENVSYRMTVGVERPDISVSVSVVALFQCEQISAFRSPEIAQLFGEMVAIPTLYPYARAKLQELTVDSGVGHPVLLGILDMTKAVRTPTEQNESDAADDAEDSGSNSGAKRSVGDTPPANLG